MLGRDGAAHARDLLGPAGKETLAGGKVVGVSRQHVHVQVVGADVAPRRALQAALGQRAAVERHHVVEVLVRHGHVASQLGDDGVGATAPVDEHVDALGHGVAKEALALAVDVGAGHPSVVLAGTHLAQGVPHEVELPKRRGVVGAVELDVNTDDVARGHVGQAREGGGVGALRAQDVEGTGVEVLDGGGIGEARAHGHSEVERRGLALEEAAHAPDHGRVGHERKLDLGDDAQRAIRAHEQVEGVHVVGREVARRVLGVGHLVGGQVERELAAALGREVQCAARGVGLAPAQG